MILYCGESTQRETEKRFSRIVEEILLDRQLERIRSVEHLARRLRRLAGSSTVAVLVAAGRSDLLRLLSLEEWIEDVRILLVLPDRRRETIAMGHRLRPRFLSYVDSDPGEIASVLARMLEGAAEGTGPRPSSP